MIKQKLLTKVAVFIIIFIVIIQAVISLKYLIMYTYLGYPGFANKTQIAILLIIIIAILFLTMFLFEKMGLRANFLYYIIFLTVCNIHMFHIIYLYLSCSGLRVQFEDMIIVLYIMFMFIAIISFRVSMANNSSAAIRYFRAVFGLFLINILIFRLDLIVLKLAKTTSESFI